MRAGETLHALGRPGVEIERAASAGAGDRCARPLRRQPDRLRVVLQPIEPEARQTLAGLARHQRSLPRHVVRVVERGCGRWRVPCGGVVAIRVLQFVEHQSQRPEIDAEMMRAEHEPVLAGGAAEDVQREQRPRLQIDRCARERGHLVVEAPGVPARRVTQLAAHAGRKPLHQLAVDDGDDGPQRLVTCRDARARGRERGVVELAAHDERTDDAVRVGGGLQPIEEPQRSLADRERRFGRRCRGRQRRRHERMVAMGERRRELVHRAIDERRVRDRLAHQSIKRHLRLRQAQRVDAKRAERLVDRYVRGPDAHRVGHDPQHLVSDRDGPSIGVDGRRFVRWRRRRSRDDGQRACLIRDATEAALHLAAAGPRDRAAPQQHDLVGEQLEAPRQRVSHRRADRLDLRRREAARTFRQDDDALFGVDDDADRRGGVRPHARMTLLDGGLEIVRPVVGAAHDDQILETIEDDQLAVAQRTDVAGAEPRAAVLAVDRRAKCVLRRRRLPPVPVGHAVTRDPHFAALAIRDARSRLGIDDRHRQAVHRRAEPDARSGRELVRRRRLVCLVAPASDGDEQRGLGQSVTGPQRAVREAVRLRRTREPSQRAGANRLGAAERDAPRS